MSAAREWERQASTCGALEEDPYARRIRTRVWMGACPPHLPSGCAAASFLGSRASRFNPERADDASITRRVDAPLR